MKHEYPFQKALRCSATSKRTHERCKAPAVRGWAVCRFHGARGGRQRVKRMDPISTVYRPKRQKRNAVYF
jgi:hypothetical protein